MSDKTLKTEEARNAAAIERDVATGVSPQNDPATLATVQSLAERDPAYMEQAQAAMVKGDREWAAKHPGEHSPSFAPPGKADALDPLGGESGIDDEK